MSRRCCAVAACFAALPARKDTPRRCARRESPGDVLPTNRLRSTEPSDCASRTVRLPSDLRHGNERNGDPFRLPHPLRFFLPRLYLSVRLCDSSGPHKHSPCRSTTANSDYVLVSRYRHETTRNAPDRRARRHGHHRPRSPACPRCGACIARSRFFPEACIKLISLKSICQTFLANIKKSFNSIIRWRIAFRIRAKSPAAPNAGFGFAAGRFYGTPLSWKKMATAQRSAV